MKKLIKSALLATAMLSAIVGCDKLKDVEEEGKAQIDVTVKDVTAKSVSFEVKTTEKDYTYVCAVVEKSVAENANDEAAIYDAAINYLQKQAGSQSFEEYLMSQIRKGGSLVYVDKLKANTDYFILVAGISATGERAAGAVRVSFKTAEGQDGPEGDDSNLSFKINVGAVTESSVTLSVYPSDKTSTYMLMIIDQEYFNGFADDEAYFQDDLEYFKGEAADYEVTLKELLHEWLSTGDIVDETWESLEPNTPYYAYCYGLTEDGKRTTDIYKAAFTTSSVEMSDAKIDIKTEVDGATVTVSITPSTDDVLYFATYLAKSEFETTDYASEFKELAEMYAQLYIAFGLSVEDLCMQGPVKGNVYPDPNTEYVFAACVMSTSGYAISDAFITEFKTGDVKPSNNQITLNVEAGSTSATVSATTTTDEPYVMGVVSMETYSASTEAEIIKMIVDEATDEDGDIDYFQGDDETEFSGLTPETQYVAVAVGCQGGVITTSLFKATFTTKEGSSAADGSVYLDAYYFDGDEVYKNYGSDYADLQGYAFFCVDATTEGVDKYYWTLFKYSDDVMNASDEQLISYLLEDEDTQTDDESGFILPWDTKFVLVYFGANADSYTAVTRYVFTTTKANAEQLPAPTSMAKVSKGSVPAFAGKKVITMAKKSELKKAVPAKLNLHRVARQHRHR